MARPRRIDQVREPALGAGCDDQVVHMEAVRATREALPPAAIIDQMSRLFTALGDPTRLRIVAALAERELCVCDIAASLGLSNSATSHQLRTLRQQGLVRARREGRLVYYALDDEHVTILFNQAREHAEHQPEVVG